MESITAIKKSRPVVRKAARAKAKRVLSIEKAGMATGKFVKRTSKLITGTYLDPLDYKELYLAQPVTRIDLIKKGLPAIYPMELSRSMGISKELIFETLQLPRSTVDKKAAQKGTLPREQAERVLGLGRLIGQVKVMVTQSGNPEGFDAARWVAHWMAEPLPALGGKAPAEYMDTVEGQAMISNLIAKMQSGAVA